MRELCCGGVAVWGNSNLGEWYYGADTLCGGYGAYQTCIHYVLDVSLVFREICDKLIILKIHCG